MSMTTELAQRMKAAALKATQGKWMSRGVVKRREGKASALEYRGAVVQVNRLAKSGFELNSICNHLPTRWRNHEQCCLDAEFTAIASPANVLALVEALEAAEHKSSVDWEAAASLNVENVELKRRIAELEARTLTVKLRNHDEFEIEHMVPDCPEWYAKGWIDGRNYSEKQILKAGEASGISVVVEGK